MEGMKKVFKGRLLNVFIKYERLPNGHTARFEMIRHPGAALIVPFVGKERIIMLRQLRPVIGKFIYELPAGTLGAKEPPLACARREIIEETGYSAKRLKRLGMIYPVPGYSTERIIIYAASGLKETKRIPEKDEVIRTTAFTKKAVRALFRKGGITDAKTIAALAMCGWL
jgi:ADP-ribose pyrophosphatase